MLSSCPSCSHRSSRVAAWQQYHGERTQQRPGKTGNPRYLIRVSAHANLAAGSLRNIKEYLTITSDDNKLVVLSDIVNSHVWEGGNNLLLWGKLWRLLELKVTNGAGQGKVAIDAAKVDKSTSGSDTSLFACIFVSLCQCG